MARLWANPSYPPDWYDSDGKNNAHDNLNKYISDWDRSQYDLFKTDRDGCWSSTQHNDNKQYGVYFFNSWSIPNLDKTTKLRVRPAIAF